MSEDTTSLDARIRAKALVDLKNKILVASRPLRSELNCCLKTVYPGLYDDKGKSIQAGDALTLIVSGIVETLTEREQDAAINAFMNRVDELQDQLDALNLRASD